MSTGGGTSGSSRQVPWVCSRKPLKTPSRAGVPLTTSSDAEGEVKAEVITHSCRWVRAKLYHQAADHSPPRGQRRSTGRRSGFMVRCALVRGLQVSGNTAGEESRSDFLDYVVARLKQKRSIGWGGFTRPGRTYKSQRASRFSHHSPRSTPSKSWN